MQDAGPPQEAFGLQWPGKSAALAEASAPPLDPSPVAPWAGQVALWEGDNLEAMKRLGPSLGGQVRLAYLDPPYNTNVPRAYRDSHRSAGPTGPSPESEGAWAGSPMARRRAESRHAAWLSFLLPRLILTRSLLAPEGLLALSVDDHESHHARLLLDEVFGEGHFVGTLAWRRRVANGKGARHLNAQVEHVHLYAKDKAKLPPFRQALSPAQKAMFKLEDEAGPYQLLPLAKTGTRSAARPNLRFDIEAPDGTWVACPTHQWRWSADTVAARRDELVFHRKRDGAWKIFVKHRLHQGDAERQGTPSTWYDRATTADGTRELARRVGPGHLDFPKPQALLRDLLAWACPPEAPPGWVLEPFAGSAALGEALLCARAESGGAHRYLGLQAALPLDGPYPSMVALAQARLVAVLESLGQGLDQGSSEALSLLP